MRRFAVFIVASLFPAVAWASEVSRCHIIYLHGSHFPALEGCPKDTEDFSDREHDCLHFLGYSNPAKEAAGVHEDFDSLHCSQLDCDRQALLWKYASDKPVHDALLKGSKELYEDYERPLNPKPHCD